MATEEALKPVDPGAELRAEVEAAAGKEPPEASPVGEGTESAVPPEAHSEAIPSGPVSPEARSSFASALPPDARSQFLGLDEIDKNTLDDLFKQAMATSPDTVTAKLRVWKSAAWNGMLGKIYQLKENKAKGGHEAAVNTIRDIDHDLRLLGDDADLPVDLKARVESQKTQAQSEADGYKLKLEDLAGSREFYQKKHTEVLESVASKCKEKIDANQRLFQAYESHALSIKEDIAYQEKEQSGLMAEIQDVEAILSQLKRPEFKSFHKDKIDGLRKRAADFGGMVKALKEEQRAAEQKMKWLKSKDRELSSYRDSLLGKPGKKSEGKSEGQESRERASAGGGEKATSEQGPEPLEFYVDRWNAANKTYPFRGEFGDPEAKLSKREGVTILKEWLLKKYSNKKKEINERLSKFEKTL